MKRLVVIIPTLNGGEPFRRLLASLKEQTYQPDKIIVIDSGSTDQTVPTAHDKECQVYEIAKSEFNHGATRQMGVELAGGAEFICFTTQDAVFAGMDAIEKIMACFDDPAVGGAYGRQLPASRSGLFAAHARLFNYPGTSLVKTLADAKTLGIKAAFFSNVFAVYRRNALLAVGGFPADVILGEDTYAAAKMLLTGWKIYYCAEAGVYHSHDYSIAEEFRRSFDTGVFHARQFWLLARFGKAEGEGLRFAKAEILFLLKERRRIQIPASIFRCMIKFFGYRCGRAEKVLPLWLKQRMSMYNAFWSKRH